MKILIQPLIVSLLLLTSLIATADEVYYSSKTGNIAELTSKAIRLSDALYPFMPTLKVLDQNGKPVSASSLSEGDHVKITILYMDKKRRVDTIQKMVKPKL